MRMRWCVVAAGLAGIGTLGCAREEPQPGLFAEDTVDPDRVDSSQDRNETDQTGVGGSGTSGADLDRNDPARDARGAPNGSGGVQ